MKQANPINITHIDHLVIRVNDLENMIAFYRDVLGCNLERGPGEAGLAQLRAGHSLIDLVDAGSMRLAVLLLGLRTTSPKAVRGIRHGTAPPGSVSNPHGQPRSPEHGPTAAIGDGE